MRRTITLAAVASVFAACIGDRVPTEQSPTMGPKGPLFNHVGTVVPTAVVNVNNYVLALQPDRLWNAAYKGTGVLFAGELSYGNAPDAVFFYDATGLRSLPSLQGAVLPIETVAPGPFADHQTVSLLIEKTAGPSLPLGLIVVRETFAFGDAPDDDHVILKYTLFNASRNPVEGLHVGQILDIDVDNATSNVVEYDPVGDLVRVSPSPLSATPVAGHALLQLPATSYRAATNPFNFGLTPADPRTTAEGFDFLSGGIVNPGPFGPADVRHTLSYGPVTVGGGEGEVFAFALSAGDDPVDLANNIVAARARYRALPKAARRPYPVIAVEVTIEPWPVDPAIHTEFTATLRGVPRKLVALFDRYRTYCGVPPLPSSPATTTVTPLRDGIRATFATTNLPPNGLGPGDEIVCAGRLSDGTLFAGRPAPTPLPVAPATRLTSVGVNLTPTWSPDGSAVAFASDRSGTFAIWRMNVAAGEASAVRLTDGPDDHEPDWHGSTIAFARGSGITSGAIYTIPDASGAIALINADGRNPRYSPSGGTLAFVRVTDNFHVWTMPTAATGETEITGGGLEFHPEWSSDGAEIYFTAFDGAGAIVKVAAAGGAPVRVTPAEGTDNRHPAVSPDGRWLAFTSGTFGCPTVVLQDLQTGDHTVVALDDAFACPRPVTGAGSNQNLEFSPDGKRILFTSDGQIWVADLSGVIP